PRDHFKSRNHSDSGGITSAALCPTGRLYYIGCRDGSLFSHNSSTGGLLHATRNCHKHPITTIVFCSNPSILDFIVTLCVEQVQVHDSELLYLPHALGVVEHARCVDFCETSSVVCIGNASGKLLVFRAENFATSASQRVALEMPNESEVTAIRVVPKSSL